MGLEKYVQNNLFRKYHYLWKDRLREKLLKKTQVSVKVKKKKTAIVPLTLAFLQCSL